MLPAGEIERFVVDQIKCIGRDPVVIRETLVQARRQAEDQIERLRAELVESHAQLRDDHAQLVTLAANPGDPGLADAHDQIRNAERRLTEIEDELVTLDGALVDESEVVTALGDFHSLWVALAPVEQSRVVEMLVDGIAYDGHAGNISITFRPAGIKMLVGEMARTEDGARSQAKGPFRAGTTGQKKLRDGHGTPTIPAGRVPRVAKLMALAIRLDRLIRDGVVTDQAELARIGYVTRARLTQIMNLLQLAPDIQEDILFLPATERGRDVVTEKQVRVIAGVADWEEAAANVGAQRSWLELDAKGTSSTR